MDSAVQQSSKSKAPQDDSNESSDETGVPLDGSAKSKYQNLDELIAEGSITNEQASTPMETIKSQDPSTKASENKKARQKRQKANARARKRATTEGTGGEEEPASGELPKKKQKEPENTEKTSTSDSNGQDEEPGSEEPVKKKQKGATDAKKVKKPKATQKEKAEK